MTEKTNQTETTVKQPQTPPPAAEKVQTPAPSLEVEVVRGPVYYPDVASGRK